MTRKFGEISDDMGEITFEDIAACLGLGQEATYADVLEAIAALTIKKDAEPNANLFRRIQAALNEAATDLEKISLKLKVIAQAFKEENS